MNKVRRIFLNPSPDSVSRYLVEYVNPRSQKNKLLKDSSLEESFLLVKEELGLLSLCVAKTVGSAYHDALVLRSAKRLTKTLFSSDDLALAKSLIALSSVEEIRTFRGESEWSAVTRQSRCYVLEILMLLYKLYFDSSDEIAMRNSVLDAGVAWREKARKKEDFFTETRGDGVFVSYKVYEPYVDKEMCYGIYSTRPSSCRRAFNRTNMYRSMSDEEVERILLFLPAAPGVFLYFFSWAQSWTQYPKALNSRSYPSVQDREGKLDAIFPDNILMSQVWQNLWFSGNRKHNEKRLLSDFVLAPYIYSNPWWYEAVSLKSINPIESVDRWWKVAHKSATPDAALSMVYLLTTKNSMLFPLLQTDEAIKLAMNYAKSFWKEKGEQVTTSEPTSLPNDNEEEFDQPEGAEAVQDEQGRNAPTGESIDGLDEETFDEGSVDLIPVAVEWSSGSIFGLSNFAEDVQRRKNESFIHDNIEAESEESPESNKIESKPLDGDKGLFYSLWDDFLNDALKVIH